MHGYQIEFVTTDGRTFNLYHEQDCCESVYVEDRRPILHAEEVSPNNEDGSKRSAVDKYDDSFTWTFYRLSTIKGSVTIRFYGRSNGYYSESVDFKEVTQ